VAVPLPTPDNKDVERLKRVVEAIVAGDETTADAEIAPIAGLTCELKPLDPMPTLPRSGWPPGIGVTTRSPSVSVIAGVYVRDSFTCSYCSRKTIVLGVLRLLSLRFGDVFPFHPNWKKSEAHRAYWDISTSLDHAVPVSRGGEWHAIENLVTACARCQYQKANHPLEVLGWERRVAESDWDGLVGQYRALWESSGNPPGNHKQWIATFEQALPARSAEVRLLPE
jgi:hypothetical protein